MTVPGPVAELDRRHPMFTLPARAASPGTDHPARLRASPPAVEVGCPHRLELPTRGPLEEKLSTRQCCLPILAVPWPSDPHRPTFAGRTRSALGPSTHEGSRRCRVIPKQESESRTVFGCVAQIGIVPGASPQTPVAPNAEQRTGVLTRDQSSGVRDPKAGAGRQIHDLGDDYAPHLRLDLGFGRSMHSRRITSSSWARRQTVLQEMMKGSRWSLPRTE